MADNHKTISLLVIIFFLASLFSATLSIISYSHAKNSLENQEPDINQESQGNLKINILPSSQADGTGNLVLNIKDNIK